MEVKKNTDCLPMIRAIAVSFYVLSISGGPRWLELLGMACGALVLLMTVGYELRENDVLAQGMSWLKQLFRKVYIPLIVWSTLLVSLHDVLLYFGAIPGTSHHVFHHLWKVMFSFTVTSDCWCYSYGVLVLLWVAPILFVLLYRCISLFTSQQTEGRRLLLVTLSLVAMALLQIIFELRITTLPLGGLQEAVALACVGSGALLHKFRLDYKPHFLAVWGAMFVPIVSYILVLLCSSSASSETMLLAFLPSSLCVCYGLLCWSETVSASKGWVVHAIQYIGRHTIGVIGFCGLSFQVAGIIIVLTTDLSWSSLSAIPIIADERVSQGWFLLYFIMGLSLPLSAIVLWRYLDKRFNLTWINCILYLYKGTNYLVVGTYRLLVYLIKAIWTAMKDSVVAVKDILKASNPNEE